MGYAYALHLVCTCSNGVCTCSTEVYTFSPGGVHMLLKKKKLCMRNVQAAGGDISKVRQKQSCDYMIHNGGHTIDRLCERFKINSKLLKELQLCFS